MKIAFVRTDERTAVSTQEQAAAAWSADRVIHVDRKDHQVSDVDVRRGDVVGIYDLHLLAARGMRAKKRARESLVDYMKTIFDAGATIEEIRTGRTCESKADLVAMFSDACDSFLSGYKTGRSAGRPRKHVYSDSEREHIAVLWNDKRHKNNLERVAAVQRHYSKFNRAAWYAMNAK
ncbi:MAG: hypothetical protein ACR2O3_09720 [Rhizobiaceae bacterium]